MKDRTQLKARLMGFGKPNPASQVERDRDYNVADKCDWENSLSRWLDNVEEPAKRIRAALILDSVKMLDIGPGALNRYGIDIRYNKEKMKILAPKYVKQLREEARNWFLGLEPAEESFSFEQCCQTLDLDPEKILKIVLDPLKRRKINLRHNHSGGVTARMSA